MTTFFRLIEDNELTRTVEAGAVLHENDDAFFNVYVDQLIAISQYYRRKRPQNGIFERLIATFADEADEHPLRDHLKHQIIPDAIDKIMEYLPTLLDRLTIPTDQAKPA